MVFFIAKRRKVYYNFNGETRDGRDMRDMSYLLSDAITSIIDTKEESDIDSLFKAISNGNVVYDVVDSYQFLLDKVMK